jgi:hypothetical protein
MFKVGDTIRLLRGASCCRSNAGTLTKIRGFVEYNLIETELLNVPGFRKYFVINDYEIEFVSRQQQQLVFSFMCDK